MPPLNTPQRLLLAAVGVAIIAFQLYRFSQDGVEGIGWVLAFLVSAVLLLPATGMLSKSKAPAVATTPTPIAEGPVGANADRLSRAKAKVEALVSRALERARVLHRQLPILLDLPPMQAPELREINALMSNSWLQYCIAFTGCLSLLTEIKKNSRFMKQPDYSVTWQLLVNEIVKAEAQTAAKHGLQANYDMQKSMQWATRDMCEAELAMKKFMDRLAAGIPDPDSPMIDYLMDKMGAPELTRQALTVGLQRFTKETLQQFSAA